MSELSRRDLIVTGAGFAFGTALSEMVLGTCEAQNLRRRRTREPAEEVWPYVKLDPAKCRAHAYDLYVPWGCMYASVKAGILEYASAVESTQPAIAAVARSFPFLGLRSGKTGLGGMKTLCGAVNGASFFMGLFVEDYNELCQMIAQLSEYVKTTPMPQFVPEKDQNPNFVQSISNSIICKESIDRWLSACPDEEYQKLRQERCKRYTGTVLGRAVEILNDRL